MVLHYFCKILLFLLCRNRKAGHEVCPSLLLLRRGLGCQPFTHQPHAPHKPSQLGAGMQNLPCLNAHSNSDILCPSWLHSQHCTVCCTTLTKTLGDVPSTVMHSQRFPAEWAAKEEAFLKLQQHWLTARSPLSDIDTLFSKLFFTKNWFFFT